MRKTRLPLTLGVLAVSLPAAAPVLAQGAPIQLDAITLIGTGLPTEVMTNPASITVIEAEAIAHTAPVTVTALLRDVPGLQVSEEGIERVSLRGEESSRVAILIDGQALTDHTGYGTPVLVDPTMIERIEVVRGSSSVVSGNRAIGGAINIITKRGADRPLVVTATGGWISATRGHRGSVTAAGTVDAGAGQFDYRLTWGRMSQGDRHTPDGVLEDSATNDRTLSAHLGYRLGDHYFGLKAQRYDLAAQVYTGDPDFIIDLPRRDLRKVGLFYEGTDLAPWLDRLSVDIYRQTIAREFSNDITQPMGPAGNLHVLSLSTDRQRTAGARLKAEMRFSDRSRTVAGIEYELDGLESDKDSTTTMPGVPMPITSLRYDKATIRTLSVFAQHEIDVTDDVTAIFGGRWYHVEASHDASRTNGAPNPTTGSSDSLALGSVGLVWSPSETYTLRANISQGYIYPTLGQLFLTTTAGGTTITGNPDLKPEQATTFELGARMAQGGAQVDATLFYSRARDYIATFSTGPRTGSYENVDAARSWGLEVHAEYASDAWGLTPYATVALLRRELEYGNGYTTRDGGAPAVSGRIGLRKSWSLAEAEVNADLFLRGESRVTLRDSAGAVSNESAGWATVNLSASVQWDSGLSLVAELTNLGNRSYEPYGQMPGAERGISLFVTKAF